MQENFIEEIESRGKQNVKDKENRIQSVLIEENELMNSNVTLEKSVDDLTQQMDEVTGATEKFVNLGNLKG